MKKGWDVKKVTKNQEKILNSVFMYLSVVGVVVMLSIAALAFWAHSFTTDMVRTELAAQKVYFPDKGSPELDPATYPELQKYAGQLVDTPEEAKAYANGYIGEHLRQIADGKVYAEVSSESMKDPNNKELQAQKQSLFQGETLRGILLTSGYGFGTIGKIAGIVAYVAVAMSVALGLLAIFFKKRS